MVRTDTVMQEQSDKIEIECKFNPLVNDEATLSLIRQVAVPRWSILRLPPITQLDIYFDTEDLTLHRAEALFRIRKRGKPYQKYYPKDYSANFKEPTRDKDASILARREVRTKIEADEVLSYTSDSIPGKAARCAYKYINVQLKGTLRSHYKPIMTPIAYIVSNRRVYNIGPIGTDKKPMYPPWGALVHLVLEDVTGFCLRHSRQTSDLLISKGNLNLTGEVEKAYWVLGEVELARHFPNLQVEAERLFHRIVETLDARGLTAGGQSKYSTFMNILLGA